MEPSVGVLVFFVLRYFLSLKVHMVAERRQKSNLRYSFIQNEHGNGNFYSGKHTFSNYLSNKKLKWKS